MFHIAIGALVGAAIGAAASVVTAKVTGRPVTWRGVLAGAVGGAVGGAVTVATFGSGGAVGAGAARTLTAFVAGGAAGGGASQVTDNAVEGRPLHQGVPEATAIGGAFGAGTYGAGRALAPVARRLVPGLRTSPSGTSAGSSSAATRGTPRSPSDMNMGNRVISNLGGHPRVPVVARPPTPGNAVTPNVTAPSGPTRGAVHALDDAFAGGGSGGPRAPPARGGRSASAASASSPRGAALAALERAGFAADDAQRLVRDLGARNFGPERLSRLGSDGLGRLRHADDLLSQGRVREALDVLDDVSRLTSHPDEYPVLASVLGARNGTPHLRTVNASGRPSSVLTQRPSEMPYRIPPEMTTVRPGQPLNMSRLDPARRYLWVVDENGGFRIAPETQRGFGVNGSNPAGRVVKHGDLIPGPGGQSRGIARSGGELYYDATRGRWTLDNNSSYTFARTDGTWGSAENLTAARELLNRAGSDVRNLGVNDVLAGRR